MLGTSITMRYAGLLAVLVLLYCRGIQAQPAVAAPAPVTVIGVQGNGGKAFRVVNEFLTGCSSSSGTCTDEFLHLPDELKAGNRHLHKNLQIRDYSLFYVDTTILGSGVDHGKDSDVYHGLETATVVFYIGHGYRDYFHALFSKQVPLSDFSLGDLKTRYLWMVSCNIMGHGPTVTTALYPKGDYLQPQSFDPTEWRKPQSDHANAFYRWTGNAGKKSPLNPGLRLVCGGSSHIGSLLYPTVPLWHYYSIVGLGPAESFLLGLYTPHSGGLPLCMSRGGDSLASSGLADGRFAADPLTDVKRVYMQYPLPAESNDPLVAAATGSNSILYTRSTEPRNDEPKNLPVLEVTGAPVPPILGGINFSGAPALTYGFRGASAQDLGANLAFLQFLNLPPSVVGENLCIKRHPGSGAISFSWRPQPGAGFLPNETAREAAREIIKRVVAGNFGAGFGAASSLNKLVLREAQAIVMRVDSVLAEKAASSELSLNDITHPEKCRYLRLTSVYREGTTEVPIFGEGGEIFLGVCAAEAMRPDPESGNEPNPCRREGTSSLSVFLGGRVAKEKDGPRQALKTRIAAQQEALGILLREETGNLYDPTPKSYRWGYKAAPVYCIQKEMYIVYEFDFAPKDGPFSDELPPITIEIPAHRLPDSAEKIEDTWECSPEQP